MLFTGEEKPFRFVTTRPTVFIEYPRDKDTLKLKIETCLRHIAVVLLSKVENNLLKRVRNFIIRLARINKKNEKLPKKRTSKGSDQHLVSN